MKEDHLQEDLPMGNGQRVLVVEDDLAVREISKAFLEHLGYNPIEAGTGERALEILKEDDEIEVLFTDVVLPGKLNGFSLGKIAAELKPGLRVLYASAYIDHPLMNSPEAIAARILLRKPYRIGDLANRLKELLIE